MARKILLADDSVTAQNMGRKILTDAGYEVVTVNNGSAALKKVAETHPDLIVLDVYMPGYSGLEVCQRLKENRETTRIPILLTVGKLEPFKPDEARRVRADAYVIKPFEASELLTALTKLEDKIVPQAAASDTHKPGRFAQAIAAFEESNADPGEKFGDTESGWKNRLRFPGRKKNEQESEGVPSAETEGAGSTSASAAPTVLPELSVTPGLPADITEDEIAAITAAAAQLSGNTGESTAASTQPSTEGVAIAQETSDAAPVQAAATTAGSAAVSDHSVIEPKQTERKQEASSSVAAAGTTEEALPATFASSTAESVTAETTREEETRGATELSQASVPEVVEAPVVAEAPAPEAAIESAKQPIEYPKEKSNGSEADADVMAALQALTPMSETTTTPTDGQASAETVAAAAAVEIAQAQGPRWIAESITVEASEANTPLEGEMQKAFAAFAAADAGRVSLPAAAISGSYVLPAIAPTIVSQATEDRVGAEVEAPRLVQEMAIGAATTGGSQVSVETDTSARGSGTVEPEPVHYPAAASVQTEESKQADAASSETQADPLRAAAWANWSQIRESIVGTSNSGEKAVGADNREQKTNEPLKVEAVTSAASSAASAEAVAAAEAGAIASIVESVMAELRPRIVEEITKKLSREKK